MSGTRLPMFPLSAVLFPHAIMPLHVFEPRYRALMHDCLEGDPRFGVVLIERGSEVGGGDQRADLGTRGVITSAAELPDGRWVLEVRGEAVIAVEAWLPDAPYPVALVTEAEAGPGVTEAEAGRGVTEAEGATPTAPAPTPALTEVLSHTEQRVRRARAVLAEHGGAPALPPDLALDGAGDADVASWQLCAAAPLSAYDAQRLLATAGVPHRLARLAELMSEFEQDLQRLFDAR
jgi:Lon protease-like protein